jgi:hypothetical protein
MVATPFSTCMRIESDIDRVIFCKVNGCLAFAKARLKLINPT